MAPAVFNTDETEQLGLAGSIPVRLREQALTRPRVAAVRDLQPKPALDEPRVAFDSDVRRSVPRTDVVLADPRLQSAVERLGRARVKDAVSRAQQKVREAQLAPPDVVTAVLEDLATSATSLRPVLNATGVLLHTNLGRAPLSRAAVDAMVAASGTTDVEFDLSTGSRARRGRQVMRALAAAVPDAEAVHVVNNGAAALVLAATVLAQGKEIVISRGEMVEIGDGFRLPDLLESTGAHLREVGTTNRTQLEDYTNAVGPRTGFVLKVHPSNFVVHGFTSSVPVEALRGVGVPVVVDIGSGLLTPHAALPEEPDATTALRHGADLVTSSGDKLLGGPQAGLLLGSAGVVDRLRRHPLARALRVDKLTLAALEASLSGPVTPTARGLMATPAELRLRAERLGAAAHRRGIPVEVVDLDAAVGGGGAPGVTLPSAGLALPERFATVLRVGDPPVVGRVEHGRCLLDLRSVPPQEDDTLLSALLAAAPDAT